MTTEDKLKDLRVRIDEAKQFIGKYGFAPAFAYLVDLKGEEKVIWIVAFVEWENEHPGQFKAPL